MIEIPDLQPFHLAIQVRSLSEAREFYGSLLDCPEGRSSEYWVDFNLFDHQYTKKTLLGHVFLIKLLFNLNRFWFSFFS